MLNLWRLEGPLAPPLDGNLEFSEFSLGLVVDPTPMQNCKFLGPLEVRKHLYQSVSQSVSQSVTYNRLYSILTRASRSKGRLRLPKVQCGTFPGPNIFRVHHISGGFLKFSHVKPMGTGGAPGSAPAWKFGVLGIFPLVWW